MNFWISRGYLPQCAWTTQKINDYIAFNSFTNLIQNKVNLKILWIRMYLHYSRVSDVLQFYFKTLDHSKVIIYQESALDFLCKLSFCTPSIKDKQKKVFRFGQRCFYLYFWWKFFGFLPGLLRLIIKSDRWLNNVAQ